MVEHHFFGKLSFYGVLDDVRTLTIPFQMTFDQ